MNLRNIFPSRLSLAIVGLLAACANQNRVVSGSGASATESLPEIPLAVASSAPVVQHPTTHGTNANDGAGTAAKQSNDPIIIRGNDKFVSPQRVPSNVPVRAASTSLKFENAPVNEVVNVMLRDLLKVDYVVHPPIDGSITLTTKHTVSADRALVLLEQALQANGIVMARDSSGTYHVGLPQNLVGIVSAPVLAEVGKPLPSGYGAVIIPLKYLGAAEMAKILQPFVTPESILRVDTIRNFLVMRGTRAEAEGWLDLVSTFDVNILRGMSVGVFPLKHISVSDVEAALRVLSGGTLGGSADATRGGGAGATTRGAQIQRGVPRLATQSSRGNQVRAAARAAAEAAGLGEASPIFGAVRVLPIERINAVMVVTPRAAYLDEIRYWIEQFDRPNLNSAEPQLFVYKVKNGSSDHLAELLNGIYGGGVSAPSSGMTGLAPGVNSVAGSTANINSSFAGRFSSQRNSPLSSFGSSGGFGGAGLGYGGALGLRSNAGTNGPQGAQQGGNVVTTMLGDGVRVMADRINNTLLIHAKPAEYEQIESTLKRLDIQRAQVLIEATIVEVTLGDGLQYGLRWAFNGGLGGGHSGQGSLGPVEKGLIPEGTGGGNVFTYTLRNAAGNISAVLSALANKSLIKVMSSPSLMVLDNHTAAIQVGSQEPVNTGTTFNSISSFTSTNVQYKDTGVMLDVTPSVSAGDLVTLDIDQIVTDLGPESTYSQTKGYPTFQQRQISSKVAVRSGETLVLGGLIKDRTSRTKSGLPLLSSIPVIGSLFGTRTDDNNRTELLVILTPRVLRTDEDSRAVSRELRDRMQGLMLSNRHVTSDMDMPSH